MGVLHGNRDRVEPPGPNLVKSRDPLADPMVSYVYEPYVFYISKRIILLCFDAECIIGYND